MTEFLDGGTGTGEDALADGPDTKVKTTDAPTPAGRGNTTCADVVVGTDHTTSVP